MTVTRRNYIVVASLLTAVVGGGLGLVAHARFEPGLPAVASIDGTPVTAEDVDVRLADVLPFASYHGSVGGERLLALRRAALDEVILDELIYREAVQQGRRPSAAPVEEALAEVARRFESREQFEQALADSGVTVGHLRRRHARAVLIRESREAHARQTVTEADVAAYYEAHATQFMRPEQAHLLELLVPVDPSGRGSAGAARKKATELAGRIGRGEDFGTLARRHSADEYQVKDGDLGFIHRGRLDSELDEAVFGANVGDVRVVRTIHGYHVFKVVEREDRTQLTLDEARPLVAERLERQRREAAVAAWHARLRAGTRVEILDAALRLAKPAELVSAFTAGSRAGRPARSQQ